MSFHTQHHDMVLGPYHLDMHIENLISGMVLVGLVTYFYMAFSKLIQPGGDKQKTGSRVYYSSPASETWRKTLSQRSKFGREGCALKTWPSVRCWPHADLYHHRGFESVDTVVTTDDLTECPNTKEAQDAKP